MRIGFIVYDSLDTLTGGYLYDRIVFDALVRRGHQVELISLPGGSYPRRLIHGIWCGRSGHHAAGRFDILIQDELCHPSLLALNRRLRRRDGALVVALVHQLLCTEPRSRWRNRLLAVIERRYLAGVDGFIFNSETTRQEVIDLAGNGRAGVIASPAGDRFGSLPSPAYIENRSIRPGPLELLFLGNVIPRKGLLPLLRALSRAEPGTWRLSVAGGLEFDPAEVARARHLAARLGLTEAVRFLGVRRGEDLIELLSASHLFCMPYACEGFGIAILESMAFGLPAIGSKAGAAGETISHDVNGFLLDPADREGLAPLLAELHRDRNRLRELALAARATFESRPGWQHSVLVIENFLQTLLQGRDRIAAGRRVPASRSGAADHAG